MSCLKPVILSSVLALGVGVSGGFWASGFWNADSRHSVEEVAQDTTAGNNPTGDISPVVARINGEDLLRADVLALAADLPAEKIDEILPDMIDELVNLRLLVQAAQKQTMDPATIRRIAVTRDNILAENFVKTALDQRVDDAAVRVAYGDYIKDTPTEREISARHILVETQDAALALIAELDGGADFVQLAKDRSTGPSGANGGDLGYFTAGRMVPEFSAAAFALAPGDYTRDPVKTQFGWHVIKVEDERETEQPSFEELEQQLRQQLVRQAYQDLTAELREGAEIEILVEKPAPEKSTTETPEAAQDTQQNGS